MKVLLMTILLWCVIHALEHCEKEEIKVSNIHTVLGTDNPCLFTVQNLTKPWTKSENSILMTSSTNRFIYKIAWECKVTQYNWYCDNSFFAPKKIMNIVEGPVIDKENCSIVINSYTEEVAKGEDFKVASTYSQECGWLSTHIEPYRVYEIKKVTVALDSYSARYVTHPFSAASCNFFGSRCKEQLVMESSSSVFLLGATKIGREINNNRKLLIWDNPYVKNLSGYDSFSISSYKPTLDTMNKIYYRNNPNISQQLFWFPSKLGEFLTELYLDQLSDNIFLAEIKINDQDRFVNFSAIKHHSDPTNSETFFSLNPSLYSPEQQKNLIDHVNALEQKQQESDCQALNDIIFDMNYHLITDTIHVITLKVMTTHSIFYRQFSSFLRMNCNTVPLFNTSLLPDRAIMSWEQGDKTKTCIYHYWNGLCDDFYFTNVDQPIVWFNSTHAKTLSLNNSIVIKSLIEIKSEFNVIPLITTPYLEEIAKSTFYVSNPNYAVQSGVELSKETNLINIYQSGSNELSDSFFKQIKRAIDYIHNTFGLMGVFFLGIMGILGSILLGYLLKVIIQILYPWIQNISSFGLQLLSKEEERILQPPKFIKNQTHKESIRMI